MFDNLSGREIDIAKRVAKGLSNLSIAEQLYITEKTVKFHMTNIFNKTRLNSRTQLAIEWCKKYGF